MIKQRLMQYLEHKGVTKYKFYKETGLSNGFLDKEGAIGSDKCEIISYQYKDLNLEWLITGKGEMLKSEKNYSTGDVVLSKAMEEIDWEREYYKVLKELNDCLKKNNELLENKSQHAS